MLCAVGALLAACLRELVPALARTELRPSFAAARSAVAAVRLFADRVAAFFAAAFFFALALVSVFVPAAAVAGVPLPGWAAVTSAFPAHSAQAKTATTRYQVLLCNIASRSNHRPAGDQACLHSIRPKPTL